MTTDTSPDPAGGSPITLVAADGWVLGGLVRRPDPVDAELRAGVVLVHAGHHERDAFVYDVSLPELLAERGATSLWFDIRGRGTSRGARDFHHMGPIERRAVAVDVRAAIDHLDAVTDGGPLAVVGEQDTAAAVAAAVADDERVTALVLLSPRLTDTVTERLASRSVPVQVMVSAEDRGSLRSSVAAYLAGADGASALHVFHGLGFGTTMFAARAFEQPDEPPLEAMITDWLVERLGA